LLLIGVERISDRSDIDNRIKLILDVLVSQKVITDDRFVTAFAACWQPSANKIARVSILPVQALTLAFQPSPDGASGGWFIAPPLETIHGSDLIEHERDDGGTRAPHPDLWATRPRQDHAGE
jgi:hypothetical protein